MYLKISFILILIIILSCQPVEILKPVEIDMAIFEKISINAEKIEVNKKYDSVFSKSNIEDQIQTSPINLMFEWNSQNILPIINGLTEYSHPCQILGDFLTLQENFRNYKNLTIVWIGDYNNVLRSLIHLQNIYNFKLNVVVPNQIFKHYKNEFLKLKNKNLKYFADPIECVKKSNCIMTDVWVSMGEKNNKIRYFKNFTVNKNIMTNASNNAIFMHCLPAKRGKEVTSDVLDGKNSVVLEQAKNRMYIPQAILIYVLKN